MSENIVKETETSTKMENPGDEDLDYRSVFVKVVSDRIFFLVHLFLYLSVMGLLTLIWGANVLQGTAKGFWPMHAMFGWGFAMGAHLLSYVMYNDMVDYLSKVRKESEFGVLFIYHAYFYGIINLYLFLLNIITMPTVL